jgi:replicative DNA helicase
MNPEQLVISCILNDQSIHDIIIPELKTEYFHTDRDIAQVILTLYKQSKAVDTYTIINALRDRTTDILSMSNLCSSAANVTTYLAELKDNYLRREVFRWFGVQIGNDIDPHEYLATRLRDLTSLQELMTPSAHRTLVEIIEETLSELSRGRDAMFGVPTPLTELNNITNGWQPADLIVLAGRPSRGKTAFALANVRSACEAGKRCVVFSLEMKDTQLMKRLIWSIGSNYDEAGGIISKWKLDIFERGGIDVPYIVGNSRLIKRMKGLDLIVIDYLGLMRLPKAENRAYSIGEATRALKALAKELDVPIILLAQLNREIEKRTNRKHELSDLRESGDIEQDADIVIFISRPIMDGMTEDKDGHNTEFQTIIQVEKNRNGKAPVVVKARNNERVNYYSDWLMFDGKPVFDNTGDQPGYRKDESMPF